jgi:hypothetical protein
VFGDDHDAVDLYAGLANSHRFPNCLEPGDPVSIGQADADVVLIELFQVQRCDFNP